jgi:hypothetical protein
MNRKILCYLTIIISILSCKQISPQQSIPKEEKKEILHEAKKEFSPDTKVTDKEYENGFETLQSIFENYVNSQIFLTPREAAAKWGHKKFNAKQFIQADEATKSSMVADFVERGIAIGQPYNKIEDLVGPRTGYFLNEQIVAVIFIEGEPQRENKAAKDTYQLVFFSDKSGNVSDVRIHKQ